MEKAERTMRRLKVRGCNCGNWLEELGMCSLSNEGHWGKAGWEVVGHCCEKFRHGCQIDVARLGNLIERNLVELLWGRTLP